MKGIILFAHGSRDPAWHEPIEAVARRMREMDPATQVACAYLELTEPNLETCVAELRSTGVHAITIWPMFLGSGRHAREDLPRLVADLRRQHSEIKFTLKAAMGEHPEVLEAMARVALASGR